MSEQPEKERSGQGEPNDDHPLALHAALCSREGRVRFLRDVLVKRGLVEAVALEDPMGYDGEITIRAIEAMADDMEGVVAELCIEIGRGMAVWESLTANVERSR